MRHICIIELAAYCTAAGAAKKPHLSMTGRAGGGYMMHIMNIIIQAAAHIIWCQQQ